MSYLDNGYNEFLEIPRPSLEISALDYDSNIQDGSVVNSKIGSLTWDKGYGGTLQLGGQNNQAGLMSLVDEFNSEKIRLDKDGMLINDGKITIKDNSNQSIIDSSGLISTANFNYDSTTQTTGFETTSTSYVDVTDTTLSFTVNRTVNVIIMLTTENYSSGQATASAFTNTRILLDGNQVGEEINIAGFTYGGSAAAYLNGSCQTIQTVNAGEHTIKVQLKTSLGGYTAYVGGRTLIYLILGS